MKKTILLLLLTAFFFSACNKCKECTHDNYEWTIYDGNYYDNETFGDQILEICSDNFESKKDFNDYIDEMEDNDWDCKSDFWN